MQVPNLYERLHAHTYTNTHTHTQAHTCMLIPHQQSTHLTNPLRWRHNERDGVSNHQPHDCLLNRLFRGRSKKTSKLRVTGLCVGNSPVTGEFPAQRASNAENVSIWWRHHAYSALHKYPTEHHFVTEMCTRVNNSVTKWCSVGYGIGELWDLYNRSNRLETCLGAVININRCSGDKVCYYGVYTLYVIYSTSSQCEFSYLLILSTVVKSLGPNDAHML